MNVEKVIGIDVASESLTISIYDGKRHDVKTLNYTKSDIRKTLINPFLHNRENFIF